MRRDFKVAAETDPDMVAETLLKNPDRTPSLNWSQTKTKVVTSVVTGFANTAFRS